MTDMPEHQPPKFIVKQPREVTIDDTVLHTETYHEFDDTKACLDKAREIAKTQPGTPIDIYQHATAVIFNPERQ
jgi:hypothetical protein